ncbi:MAG: DNA primase [Paludibacteraceae bacterium]
MAPFLPLPMIDQSTIARIMDAAQIVDVVSDYMTLKKRGANWWGVCPFHNEKTPSFSVSPAKGIFKCFGCGKGGNAVQFVMEHEHLTYYDALRLLAKKYHIEIQEREQTDDEKQQEKERESLQTVTEFAAKFFEETLHNTDEGQSVGISYLRERGFSDDIIRKFRIGYAPDAWDTLVGAATAKNYSLDYMVKANVCNYNDEKKRYYDTFRGRVIFPWITISGKVVAFSGRVLSRDTKGVVQKYVNTCETPLFVKSNELFGIFQAKNAITKADCVYIVEGQTDVISMHQCGVENVVACSGGSGLKETQAHLLHRFTANIILMYDTDAAGEKYTDTAISVALNEGMNVHVVRLPEDEDPDSFARKNNANAFIDYIAQHKIDFATYICQKIAATANDPIKKSQLITEQLTPALALIYNNILLAEYIKQCAKLLDLSEEMLLRQINKLRDKKRKKEQEKQQGAGEQTSTETTNAAPDADDLPDIVTADNKFDTQERCILNFALRHGNEVIFTDEAAHAWTVNEFIVSQLIDTDNIALRNPLHQAMLHEIAVHLHDADFDAAKFFIRHADPRISQLAADLLADRYMLSKMFADTDTHNSIRNARKQQEKQRTMADEINKVIIEYKYLIVTDDLTKTMAALKQTADPQITIDLLAKITQLNRLKAHIAQELGERIIVKL